MATDKIAHGAAQGIGSGDKRLALDHIRRGDLVARIIDLGGRQEGIRRSLENLDEINRGHAGSQQKQHRLDEERNTGKLQQKMIAHMLSHPVKPQHHRHFRNCGNKEGNTDTAAVAAKRAENLNEIVFRHGVEHGQQHNAQQGHAIPLIPQEKDANRAAFLSSLPLLCAAALQGRIAKGDQNVEQQQSQHDPQHPVRAPGGNGFTDGKGSKGKCQGTDTAAKTIIYGLAACIARDADSIHQGHHGVKGKDTQQI